MATITITAAAGPAGRLAHAVGVALNLGRDATIPEVTQWVITDMRALVTQVERNEANAALVILPVDLT